jgi:hypothetical protein
MNSSAFLDAVKPFILTKGAYGVGLYRTRHQPRLSQIPNNYSGVVLTGMIFRFNSVQ